MTDPTGFETGATSATTDSAAPTPTWTPGGKLCFGPCAGGGPSTLTLPDGRTLVGHYDGDEKGGKFTGVADATNTTQSRTSGSAGGAQNGCPAGIGCVTVTAKMPSVAQRGWNAFKRFVGGPPLESWSESHVWDYAQHNPGSIAAARYYSVRNPSSPFASHGSIDGAFNLYKESVTAGVMLASGGLFEVASEVKVAEETTTVIGRVKDLEDLAKNEESLLSRLPDRGSPSANWAQNSGVLRTEMNRGLPIRDASPGDTGGQFLNAERALLRDRGWTLDSKTNFWNPPK